MEKVNLIILGATEGEISPLADLKTSQRLRLAGRAFSLRIHGGLKLLVGETGIGKVNAAAVAAAALSNFAPAEVWNVGCAGAYPGSGLEVGDVLVTTSCLFADEGILTEGGPMPVSGIGIPLVVKEGLAFSDSFPLSEYIVRGRLRSILPEGFYGPGPSGAMPIREGSSPAASGFRVRYGPSLTVGMVSGDAKTASDRFHRFAALAENMEGSAIAQTCLLFDVPFLEFRGVSNVAGERDKAHWDLAAAVSNCLAVANRLLAARERGFHP
ncbi:MAG: hypothetical protein ACP5SH_01095 [Syntrophobacteraceae bacterium]